MHIEAGVAFGNAGTYLLKKDFVDQLSQILFNKFVLKTLDSIKGKINYQNSNFAHRLHVKNSDFEG